MERRDFLVFLGWGTVEMLRANVPAWGAPNRSLSRKTGTTAGFDPIKLSRADALVLPKGFSYDILATTGDVLGSQGPNGQEVFGDCADFVAYFPKNKNKGLLWVNHESIVPQFITNTLRGAKKTKEQVEREKLMVGGSFVMVEKQNGKWQRSADTSLNRRFTALYPNFEVTGPAKKLFTTATGTLANCSGGVTPWGTVLSCEENYHLFNPVGELGWETAAGGAINEDHFGWVIETDPDAQIPPRKHSCLGRFAHENCSVSLSKKGHVVVYMGDDSADECIYKFISSQALKTSSSRQQKSDLLSEGTLYVASFEKGKWLPLDVTQDENLKKAFGTQEKLLLNTRKAAKIVGGTPLDRPEDCEVDPKDGSLYIAASNNKKKSNYYGQIIRLIEDKEDAASLSFRYEIFLAGGSASGLACPDNLCFDNRGNLWVSCDISASEVGNGKYAAFPSNGLFAVPLSGKNRGVAYAFASGPMNAELTGPCFTSDFKTLFLSVQHPGEESPDSKHATSHWPDGGNSIPRSATVAIRGF